jgi:ABC-type Fe3+ transport system substrate-binding protein
MLDAATLVLLTKLKMLAKKTGVNVDLVKMGSDQQYAEHTLGELSNSEDGDLVVIVIQLMNQFGMIKAPTDQPKKDEEKDDGDRYVGSLR